MFKNLNDKEENLTELTNNINFKLYRNKIIDKHFRNFITKHNELGKNIHTSANIIYQKYLQQTILR